MADLLEGWANFQEAGLASSPPFEVRARTEAASDLMEQVGSSWPIATCIPLPRSLLPAPPSKNGSEHLCSSMDAPQAARSDSYGAALKAAGVVDGQEAKQVTAWAGLRDRAAHGEELNTLTTTEARIMADGINFFLQKHDERSL